MSDRLTAYFVDGSDAEVSIAFAEKRVEVSAFDEKSRQRYRLIFADCTAIEVTYSNEPDEWADLHNLTDGIAELEEATEGVRRFQIGFCDESLLEILCKDFSMTAIGDEKA